MPPDIRSFFGGKPAQASQDRPATPAPSTAKKGRNTRKVLEDSDDDGPTKKASPKKAAPKKRDPTPEGEATNASEYFGKAKPKKTAPVRSSTDKKVAEETPKNTPVKSTTKSSKNGTAASVTATPTGRTSSRRKAPVDYSEAPRTIKLDDEDEGDDVFEAEFKTKGKGLGDDYEEDDEEANDLDTKPRRVGRSTGRQSKILDDEDPFEETEDVDMKDVDAEDDFVVLDEDEAIEVDRPAKSKKEIASAAKKRKSHELDEDDEDSTVTPKKARGAKKGAPKKSPAKKKEKEADMPENAEMQAIFDSIPLVRPPTPPSQVDAKKFKFGGSHANTGPPPAADSKEIPVGADNCLAGLSFVFTGLLQVLQRDDAQNLVKRYGGKIVGAPSSKTSFVVLGSDAGPKKLETIAKFKIKTIDEDGLFELIKRLPANGGDSKAAAKNEEKKKAEMDKIKEQAAEIEKAERVSGGAGGAAVSQQNQNNTKPAGDGAADTRLWTVKYAPTSLAQICGNKQSVEKLQRWLRDFPKNAKRGFKLAGQDGSGVFRAVIISGPPGIGKTTAAHLVAKLEGYDIVESNASETRSKKLVEGGLKGTLDTTSLLGYFAGDGKKVETSKKKLCLIMDEVDGMSAGDRGGVGALAAVCKKTEVPMILICNERRLPKLKPFDYCTFALPFRRPTTDQIRSRIMTINYREGLKLPGPVLDALIEGTGADIRQVVNMVSTIKTDQNVNDEAVDFDKSKQMSKAWQKHVVLRPWDILGKILGGGLFTPTSKSTLNDKIELYFNDHEFSYLMLAENYLGTAPIRASQLSGREKTLKTLELVEQAANSISDGDLVDRLIHGPEQQWSLMPTHAVFSFVRPASYVAGTMAGHSSAFPAWLGKNSTQGKNLRAIKEIQGHMRLRASGDRHEIRQQYIPLLWSKLIKKLETEGKEGVPETIDLMDSYFLTKDDWDAIVELGVGPMDQETVKLDSQTKATFTRLYNGQNHPMPFMKASNVVAPKRTAKEKPDLEEALDESDEADFVDDVKEEDEDEAAGDLSKDKYVKQAKKKKTAKPGEAPKATGKGKKKVKAEQSDDEDEDEEDVKPKKGKGRAPAKGKARK